MRTLLFQEHTCRTYSSSSFHMLSPFSLFNIPSESLSDVESLITVRNMERKSKMSNTCLPPPLKTCFAEKLSFELKSFLRQETIFKMLNTKKRIGSLFLKAPQDQVIIFCR